MTQTVQEIRYAFERDMVRRKGYGAFKRQPMAETVCVWCGDGFTRNVGAYRNTGMRPANAVTCSPECGRLNKNKKQREWHRARYQKVDMGTRTCDVCGIMFKPRKHNQKRCSPSCRVEGKRRWLLERRKTCKQSKT